jgi:hypothetical protein
MSFGSYLDFAISTLPLIFNLLFTKGACHRTFGQLLVTTKSRSHNACDPEWYTQNHFPRRLQKLNIGMEPFKDEEKFNYNIKDKKGMVYGKLES